MFYFKLSKLLHNKIYITLACFICLIFAIYNVTRKMYMAGNIAEVILLGIDDRLIMLVLFSILPLLLYFRLSVITAEDIQAIARCSIKQKWYWSCLVQIILVSIFIVIIYFSLCFIVGLVLGIPLENNWNTSLLNSNIFINPDSFDTYGQPFVNAMLNNISVYSLLFQSILLLISRNIFFAGIYFIIATKYQQKWLGIFVVVFIAWIDSYFYSIFKVDKFYLLPHEFSLSTAINGITLPFILKVGYWSILNLGLQTIAYLNNNYAIEKSVLVNMKTKNTWEDLYE